MTIVYERNVPGPATHALVVGCGHFPHLPGAPDHERPACPDSAREVVRFLVDNRDQLCVPIASVECLITEAGGRAGQVAQTDADGDPRPDTAVEMANRPNLESTNGLLGAGDRWVLRCREGDHLFFYGCSHGIAERDGSAFMLLDDIHRVAHNKWANALNIHALAKELPAVTKAGACWIFLDACQELVDGVIDQIDGLGGWKLVTATATQLAASRVRSVSLAAARFGGFARAPVAGGVAHFTRALLDGLGQTCVERSPRGWSVSAKEVIFGVRSIAEVAYGQLSVETEQLGGFTDDLYFRDVADPQIPVLVTAQPSTLLSRSRTAAVTTKGAGTQVPTDPPSAEWRFRVPVDDDYVISIDSLTSEFFAKPPAVAIEVEP